MPGTIPLPGLLSNIADWYNRNDIGTKLVGGGVRGAATRGLLGMDAPDTGPGIERDIYENAARLSAPALGGVGLLASAPVAVTKAAKASKAAKSIDEIAPQSAALEQARINAVKMLGLPENNTAMDRAKALGYVNEKSGASYRGSHTAPTSVDDVGAPLHQLDKVYPPDIYSYKAAQYYGDGADTARDLNLIRRLQAVRGNPDSSIQAYRAVPKDAQDILQHGDWISPEKQYAIDHGEAVLGKGKYKVIAQRVPAKTLFSDANSIYEFGYDKGQEFASGPASVPIMRSSNPLNYERSMFAAFDPARVNENNLLAARLLPFAPAGLLAYPQED